MNILIIYNPMASNGKAKSLLPKIEKHLLDKNITFDLKITKGQWHAKKIAEKISFENYDAVVASGGDGTLFEVLNGYILNQSKTRPPLGLIPNGTGNAFMKELGLKKGDWRKAINIILNLRPKKIDIGKLDTKNETHYFINIVGLGFVASVAEAVLPIKWMGSIAYTLATLFKLISLKTEKITIEIDGVLQHRDAVFIEVANTRYTGTSFKMAPNAKLDDGLLDLVILNRISRFKLLKVFNSIYDGSHIKYPEVEYIQAKKIKITQEQPGILVPDGEIIGHSPVQVECIHEAIEFLWSNTKKVNENLN